MTETTYDVVVLGAGIAGLSAALRSAELGLDVVVLEKMPDVGGSTAMSGGFFAFTGTREQAAAGVEDSEALFRSDLLGSGEGIADERLVDAYLGEQGAAYEWLTGLGVTFGALETSSGMSAARAHNSRIRDVVARLDQAFRAAGGEILLSTRATELVTGEGGDVVGVRVSGPEGATGTDGGTTIRARRGVVIATGGFSRSTELLTLFAPEQLAAIPYGGRGNTGDGLTMAWALGAGLADVAYVSATFGSHPLTGEDAHELLTAFYMGAIIVNAEGRRYVDESRGYKILGAATLEQTGATGYEIFDSVVRARSEPGVPLVDIDALEDKGRLHVAGTLEELARAAGVDEEALVQTVDAYNRAVAGEETDELGRTGLVNGVGELVPVAVPPFYAYPAKPLMTTTYCGLTITPSTQVVRVDGRPIGGLYAIGEVTGGFHGPNYMTGTSLGKGLIFGRIVAAHLASGAGDTR
ncbi:Fumarate reductase flavoprotein subunit [Actinomycetales bacterium JB111]|nr:Fumarate reductase flavoprotein subunit [Actinomycetales bacterium JB111]